MRLKKQNGTYVVFYKDGDGNTHQKNTKQTNRADALEVVKAAGIEDLEKAAAIGELRDAAIQALSSTPSPKCPDILPEWEEWVDLRGRGANTAHTYKTAIESWIRTERLEDTRASAVTEANVSQFINPDSEVSWAGRKSRLAAVRSFCEFCQSRRYLHQDPCHGVFIKTRDLSHKQMEGTKRIPFTEREYNGVLNYLDDFSALPEERRKKFNMNNVRFWQAAIPLAYWVGLRLGDICSLQWESIDGNALTVWTQKKQLRVELPLDHPMLGMGELRRVIADLDLQHDKWVFPRQKALIMDPASRSALSHDFRRWVGRSGVATAKRKTFHCLRHSCVTRLRRASMSYEDIGKIVGHRSEAVTKGYEH